MGEQPSYRVIVIGGGHAGAEAAWAAANRLCAEGRGASGGSSKVALVTLKLASIGVMSCNPAIGGLAKGQIVREIDALGGLMGLAADATGIQFKMLNASKGPAVRGPRCQSDKYRYAEEVQRLLKTRSNLDLIEAAVEDLVVEQGQCTGIIIKQGSTCRALHADAVVLTTGTFMRGLMHTGPTQTPGGRVGELPAGRMSDALRNLGFELGRLKTGTPPRLDATTIDFANLAEQPGDATPTPFSEMTAAANGQANFPALQQTLCWSTATHELIHERIRDNLDRAPMYNGQITPGSSGPRYCPSIEDKVVRFAQRASHHVFLEPESLSSHEIYCNGISTSLPTDVQDFIIANLPGCERATILRYGYAVEYDMVRPHQIDATTMTKSVKGLFLAGQINGTSGYEEAAAQGLLAGINAVSFTRHEDLLRLGRDQAYIGVMMDDLVTKTPVEPYRMFTSRAEFRLVLRADNADERLTPIGRALGLIDDERWLTYQTKQKALCDLNQHLDTNRIDGKTLRQWVSQPQVDVPALKEKLQGTNLSMNHAVLYRLLADIQYAGYINRQHKQIERLRQQESQTIPTDQDYTQIAGLRTEAALQLNRFKPTTLGQAGRLEGVNPADLMIVSIAVLPRFPRFPRTGCLSDQSNT